MNGKLLFDCGRLCPVPRSTMAPTISDLEKLGRLCIARSIKDLTEVIREKKKVK